MPHLITREIGIDAGHRVPTHGSKCRNLHGHRYTIEACCISDHLHQEGEQKDMVLDFGFLKEEMMREIDHWCDHGFICWSEDLLVLESLVQSVLSRQAAVLQARENGWVQVLAQDGVKLYVVDFIPTAEKLAEHWFNRLAPRVKDRSQGLAELLSVRVHETPNCRATYNPHHRRSLGLALKQTVKSFLTDEERVGGI